MSLFKRRIPDGDAATDRDTAVGVVAPADGTTHRPQADDEKDERRRPRGWWLPVALFLVGAIILGYPFTSTLYNNWRQHQFSSQYNQAVAAADPGELKDVLAAAEKYNESIDGLPILDPWLERVKQDDAYRKYLEYLDQLSTTDVMARVRVPPRTSTCRSTTGPRRTPSPRASATSTAPTCPSVARTATRSSPDTPASPPRRSSTTSSTSRSATSSTSIPMAAPWPTR